MASPGRDSPSPSLLPEVAKHYLNNTLTGVSKPLDTNPNGEPFVDPAIISSIQGPKSVWGVTLESYISTETIWWVDRNVHLRFTCGDDRLGEYRLTHLYYGSRIARALGLKHFNLDGERIAVRDLNIGTWEELKRRVAGVALGQPAVDITGLSAQLDGLSLDFDQEFDTRSVVSDTTGDSTIWWAGFARDSHGHRRTNSLQ